MSFPKTSKMSQSQSSNTFMHIINTETIFSYCFFQINVRFIQHSVTCSTNVTASTVGRRRTKDDIRQDGSRTTKRRMWTIRLQRNRRMPGNTTQLGNWKERHTGLDSQLTGEEVGALVESIVCTWKHWALSSKARLDPLLQLFANNLTGIIIRAH